MKRPVYKCPGNMNGPMQTIYIVKVTAHCTRNCTKFCLTSSTKYVMYLKPTLSMPEWMKSSILVNRGALAAQGEIKQNYLPGKCGYCVTILSKRTASFGYGAIV